MVTLQARGMQQELCGEKPISIQKWDSGQDLKFLDFCLFCELPNCQSLLLKNNLPANDGHQVFGFENLRLGNLHDVG